MRNDNNTNIKKKIIVIMNNDYLNKKRKSKCNYCICFWIKINSHF